MKYLKYILPLLFAAPLVASAAISVPWQAPSPTSGPITPALVNGANKSIVATSTSVIYVNGNRTDPYTADGTYFYPYKTLTAAAASITAAGLTSVAVHVAPGTYAEPSLIWPNVPTVMYGNGASIVMMNGSFALGAGTFTVPGDFSFYDFNVFGGFSATNPSTSNPHFLTNCLLVGTSTFAGNATLNNCATLDQNTAVFPFLSQNASSTLTFQAGALGNIVGSNIQSNIVNKGVLNLNDVQVIGATSSAYLIDSSTAGSELLVNGATFINRGTGGGINCSNTATAAAPNAMTNFTVTVGVGTPTNNALNCGNAFSYVNIYSASDFAGRQYIASGPGLRAQIQTGLTVEGTSTLNAIPGTLTGLSSTTPFADLSIHANNGELTKYLFAIGSSTQTATTTLFSVSNAGAASTTQLYGAGLATCSGGNFLTWSNGLFGCAADQVGAGGGSFAFTPTTAFGTAANATSTLIGFTNGIYATASSTIGNGTQQGGLTINGGATTTGNAYFAGNVGIGTMSPATTLQVNGTTAVNNLAVGTTDMTAGGVLGAGTKFTIQASDGNTIWGAVNSSNQRRFGLNINSTGGFTFYDGTNASGSAWSAGITQLNGNVGVGSTSPWAKLSVDTSSLGSGVPEFSIGSSTRQDFVVMQSGNVGVGTAGPTAKLHVVESVATIATFQRSSAANAAIEFKNSNGSMFAGAVNITADFAVGTASGLDTSAKLLVQRTTGNVGISSTSPFARLSVHAPNGVNNTTLFAIGSSTQTATTTLFLVDNVGHTYKGGTTPTLSAGSFFGIANDNVGTVLTDTTAATIFTLTFANPWYTAPACTANFATTTSAIAVDTTTTSAVFTFPSVTNVKLHYHCSDGI